MKRIIRKCIFETNSSLQHALIIMPEETFDKWKDENLYYYDYRYWNSFKNLPENEQPVKGNLYNQEEVLEFIEKLGYKFNPEDYDGYDDFEVKDEYIRGMDLGFDNWETWKEDEYCEMFDYDYTSPSGDKLVIVAKCGRDG